MGYDIACPGWEGDFSCFMKRKHTGSSTISYGSTEYERFCKKDYERGGFGDCPHFYWYTHQYIVTAVLRKLFPNMKAPEFEISRAFRTRIENKQSCNTSIDKYDVVGPILARIVENDDELAKNIYINTIIPVARLIYQGEDKKALSMYMTMVKNLIEKMRKLPQNSSNTSPYLIIDKIPKAEVAFTKNLKR